MAPTLTEFMDHLRNNWKVRQSWTKILPLFFREKAVDKTTVPVAKWYWYNFHGGCKVMDEEWDNLLLFDAARADEVNRLVNCDELIHDKRISLGSATYEFAPNNFEDGPYLDTVYVTANPIIHREVGDKFHHVVNVWEDCWQDPGTVYPEDVAEEILNAVEEFPEKRIIGHFLQPHYPYIGEATQYLPEKANQSRNGLDAVLNNSQKDTIPGVFKLLEQGEISKETLRKAYRCNLEEAWSEIRQLMAELPGQTVVSSDHGEAFGEFSFSRLRRIYGHPDNTPARPLIEVPWIVSPGERRNVVVERRSKRGKTKSKIKTRLHDLGYA